MQRRSTRVVRIAVAASAAAASVACAAAPPAQTAPDGPIGGEIGYSYWGGTARADKVNEIIAMFEAAHPGVRVTGDITQHTSYQERTTVRASGGGLACTIGMQSTFAGVYAEYDQLRPLDDLIESGRIDVSRIPPEVLEAGRIDGRQYVIPTGTFVRPLAYNERLVAESGVGPPPATWTWEEYGAWLRQMQGGLPDGVAAAELEGVFMFTLTSWVVSHGQQMFEGERLGFDRELLAEFFEFWLSLTADGVTTAPADTPLMFGAIELMPVATGAAASGTRDIPHLTVTEGALAGTDAASDVGWTNAPSDVDGASGNVLGINGISIPSTCENVSTAAAFIDFFANDLDAARVFRSDNGVVTNTEAQAALLADPDTPDGVVRNVEVLQQLTRTGQLSSTSYPAAYSSLTRELQRQYERLAFGEISVDQAVDAFFTSADYLLD